MQTFSQIDIGRWKNQMVFYYTLFFLASLCILNKNLGTLIISFQLVKVSNIFLSSIPPRFYYLYISLRELEYSIYTLSFSLFCLIFQFKLLRVLPDFWERGISTRKHVCLNSHIWTECSVSIPFWFGAFGGALDCIARRILKMKYGTVLSSSKCKYLMTVIKWVYDMNWKNKAKHWHLSTVGNRQSKGSFWPINLTEVIFARSPTVETSGKEIAGSRHSSSIQRTEVLANSWSGNLGFVFLFVCFFQC